MLSFFHLSIIHVCLLDVDECQSSLHRCGEDQLCNNLPGSYRCECQTGYQYDSLRRMCVGMLDIIHIGMKREICKCCLCPTAHSVLSFPSFRPSSLFPSFTLLYSHLSSLSAYSAAPVYYSAVGEMLLFLRLCGWLLQ